MYRSFSNKIIAELASFAKVPVTTALTTWSTHASAPRTSDVLREAQTERSEARLRRRWENVCKLPHLGCAIVGMNMVAATLRTSDPVPNFWPSPRDRKKTECKIETLSNPFSTEGADVIYTDTVGVHGPGVREGEAGEKIFLPYQVNESGGEGQQDGSSCTAPCGIGARVSADVIDGPHSVVFERRRNRMHAQKAIIVAALSK